jgi:hypothetical protein
MEIQEHDGEQKLQKQNSEKLKGFVSKVVINFLISKSVRDFFRSLLSTENRTRKATGTLILTKRRVAEVSKLHLNVSHRTSAERLFSS